MTETVVVVSPHHRNGYKTSYGNGRFRSSFGSPPCRRGYRDFGLRDIHSTGGILPTPIKIYTSYVSKQRESFSPKTPSPVTVNEAKNFKRFVKSNSVPSPIRTYTSVVTKQKQSFSPKTPSPKTVSELKNFKRFVKSNSVPIPIRINDEISGLSYSEKWAGPAYSNSPPPSSLPIPKFSSRPKRTVSLDLPSSSAPKFVFTSLAKSAPASPTRDKESPFSGNFGYRNESATRTLRRILNLDSADE